MPPNDNPDEAASNEPLACTSCRNRKLRCDRVKPACSRCARFKADCIYPESRRKPALKRRNVRELEARLAQVETLLKDAGGSKSVEEKADETIDFNFADLQPTTEDVFLQGLDFSEPSAPMDGDPVFSMPQTNPYSFTFESVHDSQTSTAFPNELMGLGISEPLPPFEVMEELNKIFFERQQHFIPIINPTRYLQAFYSAPHMKPPMCLQYGIWALASNGHQKYHHLHDILYQRARQYADADEMKGSGEHFITVAHAQAWCIIATFEAKSMLFTRAAISSAKAVRLVEMMGLHRLDCPPEEAVATLVPPKDWTELEERRRAFWGIFCIDSHCCISTGWPHLIDVSEVTTHLPAPETAFASGQEVETCRLDEAFKGSSYSSFASAILICHLFNQILKHVHRPKPNDNPQNYDYGGFWQRHRDIDNTLSSAFMFLPEAFRLPENYRDPTSVHTNLNLHASVICLHLAAVEKADKHQLPEHVKKASQNRLFTAAQEIVNIIKMTSHVKSHPKSPLAALSLYCAASAYIYQCKETQTSKGIDNLDFIIAAMHAIGREHVITRAFLRQVILDIECNDIIHIARLPRLDNLPHIFALGKYNIPLLARSKISRHAEMQSLLPGRLPLGRPMGNISDNNIPECGMGSDEDGGLDEGGPNKRKRTSPATSHQRLQPTTDYSESPLWAQNSTESSNLTPSGSSTQSQNHNQDADNAEPSFISGTPYSGMQFAETRHSLPHRTGSPTTGSMLVPTATTQVNTGHVIPPMVHPLSRTPGQGLGPDSSSSTWNMAGVCMYAKFVNAADLENGGETDPWSMAGQGGDVDWNAVAAAADINSNGIRAGAGTANSSGGGTTNSG
ncbi:hypothetical protein BJ170DRAFT_328600 [Xylariales sp. AK1849]|nr:hypothetical protein BJ170DRAFT_328600 [Xylariales sp. AK1849]